MITEIILLGLVIGIVGIGQLLLLYNIKQNLPEEFEVNIEKVVSEEKDDKIVQGHGGAHGGETSKVGSGSDEEAFDYDNEDDVNDDDDDETFGDTVNV